MTPIPSSPDQAQRGTDEREQIISDLRARAENWRREHDDQDGIILSDQAADMLRDDAEDLLWQTFQIATRNDSIKKLELQLRALEAKLQTETEIADRACAEQTEIEEQLRARDEEIAALRKDAERYRWIRDNGHTLNERDPWTGDRYFPSGQELETEVDAALQEKSRDAC